MLLVVCADGTKLHPLIIFKGKPGKEIETECESLLSRAAYDVQERGWMDGTTWHSSFVGGLWEEFIAEQCPDALALYLVNQKCHVSDKSITALGELGTEVVPLPKNTTTVLQPLDVGIIGLFKHRVWALDLVTEADALRTDRSTPLRERLVA